MKKIKYFIPFFCLLFFINNAFSARVKWVKCPSKEEIKNVEFIKAVPDITWYITWHATSNIFTSNGANWYIELELSPIGLQDAKESDAIRVAQEKWKEITKENWQLSIGFKSKFDGKTICPYRTNISAFPHVRAIKVS